MYELYDVCRECAYFGTRTLSLTDAITNLISDYNVSDRVRLPDSITNAFIIDYLSKKIDNLINK